MLSEAVDAKKIILNCVQGSNDNGLGKYYLNRTYLSRITFADVLDIVLYFLWLQGDLEEISIVENYAFQDILKGVWKKWCEEIIDEWGYKKEYFPGSGGKYHTIFKISEIERVLDAPDVMANHYLYMEPGVLSFPFLRIFFGNEKWNHYRSTYIERVLFSKWRRVKNQKRLHLVFKLAETICAGLRERPAEV